jgi:hypothetical protein
VTYSPKGNGQCKRAAAALRNVLPQAASCASNDRRRGTRVVAGKSVRKSDWRIDDGVTELATIMAPIADQRQFDNRRQ